MNDEVKTLFESTFDKYYKEIIAELIADKELCFDQIEKHRLETTTVSCY